VAIFHLHVDIVRRSAGHSSIAAVAYRSGVKMCDERTGIMHDYTRKKDVVHSEIMLPSNAPEEFYVQSTLWNAVEKADKRKDSQTARILDVALPVELDREEQIELIRDYARENFVNHGMCADIAIHDKGDGNPHAHITLTMRHVTKDGFGNKNTNWNQTPLLEQWRENWAEICNARLQEKGLNERISHLSLEAQGIDREPTIHVGVAGKHMEARGLESDRAKENREIIARNEARAKASTPEAKAEYIHELKQGYEIVDREISVIQDEINDIEREKNILRATAESIEQRAEEIHALGARVEELQAQRQEMSLFTNKKTIDEQIHTHARSHERAQSYFEREYRISLEDAPMEIKRLESKSEDLTEKLKVLENKLPTMLYDKEEFKLEYHKRKLLADISRDREKIFDRLERLEKETNKARLSPKEELAKMRSKGELDKLNEQEFARILHEIPHGQREPLVRLRERKRVRSFERSK